MSCAQIEIKGSGTCTPTPEYLVAFPGAYGEFLSSCLYSIAVADRSQTAMGRVKSRIVLSGKLEAIQRATRVVRLRLTPANSGSTSYSGSANLEAG